MSAMTRAKPLASLSSGLLARKGQAKPAMRAQGCGGFAPGPAAALDDLGWNDMGEAQPPAAEPPAAVPPPVLSLREVLAERIEAIAEPKTVPLATAERIGCESAEQTRDGKAAFTLRLDPERHLRLRLASAVSGRSAQMLVTEALDALIETMPEVAALAAQLPAPKRRRQER